jgi:DNA-binding transcriptional ArsR family regulator
MSIAPPSATEADHLFSAETTWFHVFKSMIESGDAARLGGTVFLIYCVIKAHTNFKQGAAFPSVETIARLAGVSDRQVMRALQALEENGYLTKARHGRNNVYTLREKVTLNDPEGRPAAVATWDYLPATVEAARAELRHFMLTGDDQAPQIIHIDRLIIENLNVQVGDHNQLQVGDHNQIQAGDHNRLFNIGDIADPELREKVRQMMASRDRAQQTDENCG